MNKRANMLQSAAYVVLFSFLALVAVTLYFINFGIMNDYVLYQLQNTSEGLGSSGTLSNTSVALTLSVAQGYQRVGGYADPLFLLVYFLFFGGTIVYAYNTRPQTYFGVLAGLFYLLMFLLFFLSIVTQITDWWQVYILEALLPGTLAQMPIFSFYLDNIGIFCMIQLILCMIVNIFSMDFGGGYGILASSSGTNNISEVFSNGIIYTVTGGGVGIGSSGDIFINCLSNATIIGNQSSSNTLSLSGIAGISSAGIINTSIFIGTINASNKRREAGLSSSTTASSSIYNVVSIPTFTNISNASAVVHTFSGGIINNAYWYNSSGSYNCYLNGNTNCTAITQPNYFKSDVNTLQPFANWDFNNVWVEVPGDYPTLRWLHPELSNFVDNVTGAIVGNVTNESAMINFNPVGYKTPFNYTIDLYQTSGLVLVSSTQQSDTNISFSGLNASTNYTVVYTMTDVGGNTNSTNTTFLTESNPAPPAPATTTSANCDIYAPDLMYILTALTILATLILIVGIVAIFNTTNDKGMALIMTFKLLFGLVSIVGIIMLTIVMIVFIGGVIGTAAGCV